jgi:cytochrome c553
MKTSSMHQVIALALSLGFACGTAMANPAPAKADPKQAEGIASQVCAGCHGADGNSPVTANPSLAGQHEAYLLKQLREFKSGERKSAVMSGMVASLSEDDMRNLAAYFAAKTPKGGTAKDKDLALAGQKIYKGGNQGSGVPACASCHSPTGAGIPVQFPRLSGQHADYTEAQLNLFRNGERANDAARMMRVIATKMSPKEMKAVSQYIQGLR